MHTNPQIGTLCPPGASCTRSFWGGTSVGGGGGGVCHVTHSSHNTTYVFIFSFLIETFPDALTISWNILILIFIDYIDL